MKSPALRATDGCALRRSGLLPAAPRTPSPLVLMLSLASMALAAPCGAQIKRWVDERGMVHYSDAVPPAAQPASGPVAEVPGAAPLTPAEQADAEARRQQTRQELARPALLPASAASAAAPASAAAAASQSAAATPAVDDHSCAAQWARYNAAYACMDPYRMVNGRIRPEAFEHCPQLDQPACPSP